MKVQQTQNYNPQFTAFKMSETVPDKLQQALRASVLTMFEKDYDIFVKYSTGKAFSDEIPKGYTKVVNSYKGPELLYELGLSFKKITDIANKSKKAITKNFSFARPRYSSTAGEKAIYHLDHDILQKLTKADVEKWLSK